MRWEDSLAQNLSLTLNSDVLFYSPNENGFNLTEFNSIKAGSPFSREVGTWDGIDGLVIPEPSIWERRSNLGRVTMDMCVLGNNFLMKVNKSLERSEVVDFSVTLHKARRTLMALSKNNRKGIQTIWPITQKRIFRKKCIN